MIRTTIEEGGSLLRITLAAPPANILDIATLDALADVLMSNLDPTLRGVLLDHDGPDFSFGGAVGELLPDLVARTLHSFGRAVRSIVHAPVPVIAAVDGRCLGSGMEIALASHFTFAHADASFGQPEVTLGIFPPAAVAMLQRRPCLLRRMVLTGEILAAPRLEDAGLITAATAEPARDAALAWFHTHFEPRSAFALRQLMKVSDPGDAFDQALYQAEQAYIQRLMRGVDPVEGLQAFIDRRKPDWQHR